MISLLKLCMQIIAREWESRQEPGEGRHHEGERDIRRQILMRLQLHWEDCSSEFEKNVMRHLETWLKLAEMSGRTITPLHVSRAPFINRRWVGAWNAVTDQVSNEAKLVCLYTSTCVILSAGKELINGKPDLLWNCNTSGKSEINLYEHHGRVLQIL